ncbi:MAG: hypothetical protein ACRC9L_03815 [Brevinema sp.]
MKKNIPFLLLIFFISSCSTSPVDLSSVFIKNLSEGAFFLVERSVQETGVDQNGAPIFKEVSSLDSTTPLKLIVLDGKYTGSFIHNDLLYTFETVNDSYSGVYSYYVFGRSSDTANTRIKAYIGFKIQNDGIYAAGKKNWDAGTTLQSTLSFYGRNNIDFSKIDGGPLYQILGTTL